MADSQNVILTENLNKGSVQPKVVTEGALDKFIKKTVSFLAKITGQPNPVTGEANPIAQKVPNFQNVFNKVWDDANNVTNKVTDVANKTINTATDMANKTIQTATSVTNKVTDVANKTIDTATIVVEKTSKVAKIVANDAMSGVDAVGQTISENIQTNTKPEEQIKPQEQTQNLDTLIK